MKSDLSAIFFQALVFEFSDLPEDLKNRVADLPASKLSTIADYVAMRDGVKVWVI